MRKRIRRLILALTVIAAVVLGALLPITARVGRAANGDLVGSVSFSQQCSSGIGVGLTFDGTYLWYSCYESSTDLYRADPKTGMVAASYRIAGGLGALAYDAGRNAIWAGWGNGSSDVRLISLDASHNVTGSVVKFSAPQAVVCDLDDGLAIDVPADTLYISDDCSTSIHRYTTSGTQIDSFPWAGNGCYNSGVGIGGSLLFEGSDGCNHIWVVDKTTLQPAFNFSSPGTRDEGLTCDNVTFGKDVMWSKEAYSPMRAYAFEIPAGSCGVGGQPVDLFNRCDDLKQDWQRPGFSLTATGCNPGDPTPTSDHQPPYYGYTRVPWAYDSLGGSSYTISNAGCLLTSTADVFRAFYGLNTLPNGQVLDPGTLNTYLTNHGALPDGNFNGYTAATALAKDLHRPYSATRLNPTDPQKLLKLTQALQAGELPIVSVEPGVSWGGHWVVLYEGLNLVNGVYTDFRILDPSVWALKGNKLQDNSGLTLSQTYGQKYGMQQVLSGMFVWLFHSNANNQPQRTFVWQGHSPIQFLVTAPDGTQTGFNPTTQTTAFDITGSTYSVTAIANDDSIDNPNTSGLPGGPLFAVPDPQLGTYTLQVIGTGTGPYKIDFDEIDATGQLVTQTIAGTTLPGAVDTYQVTIGATPGQPVVVQRMVQIAIKPGSNPAPISVGAHGVVPVAILSTPTFDATTVDFQSVVFGPSATPAVDKQAKTADMNGDGLSDLVLHFDNSATGIKAGDTQACLTGHTTAGVAIIGCGAIVTVPLS